MSVSRPRYCTRNGWSVLAGCDEHILRGRRQSAERRRRQLEFIQHVPTTECFTLYCRRCRLFVAMQFACVEPMSPCAWI